MELLQTLAHNINAELDQCEGNETPYVCANIQTDQGRQKIVNLVIRRVIEQHIGIAEAIVEIELELDPNSYNN